jgi:hypothetical protein
MERSLSSRKDGIGLNFRICIYLSVKYIKPVTRICKKPMRVMREWVSMGKGTGCSEKPEGYLWYSLFSIDITGVSRYNRNV